MKFCKKCVMPDTRPGILFDNEGVCQACRAEEQKDSTNWDERFKELEALCDRHRGCNGDGFDCLIAVSGGKDSQTQVHYMKEVLGMNPLLVSVEDNFPMTNAGRHNLLNISESFGCHIISLKPNVQAQKHLMRKTFEQDGRPTWFIDRLIYTYPIHIAIKFNIKLVVYGENVSYEYGGNQRVETPSAAEQFKNGVAVDIPWSELVDDVVSIKDLYLCQYPEKEAEEAKLEPIYLSYFIRWNSYANYVLAKKLGFHDLSHEWTREHTFENFDQVDSRAYLIHPWLKYPKFGHATATDYASKFIRYGLISREEGVELVKKYDSHVDTLAVRDFIKFTGYTERRFWEIIDKLYNPELFFKNRFGEWELKNPVWKQ